MSKENKSWKIEETGIDIVAENERTGKPIELFYIWFAANISILGIVYGSIIVSFNLSFLQSVLAAVCGIGSFVLVGIVSVSGKKGRTTTLTLSRAVFGVSGNVAPTLFAWINLTGWDIVNFITGTLTLMSIVNVLGYSGGIYTKAFCLTIFSILIIVVSLFGQKTVFLMQNIFSKVFGVLTFVVVIYILLNAQWDILFKSQSGSWLSGFLPAVSIIAAGTGISWAIAGADYSRYQSTSASSKKIFTAVFSGAFIPLFVLIFTGIIISKQLPGLASAENPIDMIGVILPSWLAIPYLIAATGGIITIAVISLYSASLNMLTLGIKINRITAVAINSIIILAATVYILIFENNFIGPFVSFLLLSGLFLASWSSIFIIDFISIRMKKGYPIDELFIVDNKVKATFRYDALICWIIGAFSGLLVTNTGFWKGPFAKGIFADSSLGIILAFLLSGVLYFCLTKYKHNR